MVLETYEPILVKTHALEHLTGSRPKEPQSPKQESRPWTSILSDVLQRPLYLLFTEPVVTACSMYLALCYSIFYMSFEVFPYIFQEVYSLSPGECGLVQLTIGAGCVLSFPIYWVYERIFARTS